MPVTIREVAAHGGCGDDRTETSKREAVMSSDPKTPEDVLRAIVEKKIQKIDLRFTDLSGLWHRFSLPPGAFDRASFESGVGCDGSSIRGFQDLRQSDVLMIPDPASAFLDPFGETPTLALICNLRDPLTGQSHARDPRAIAQKAEAYLQATQIGDAACFGLKLERFLLDGAGRDRGAGSDERATAADRDAREQVVAALAQIGIAVEAHDHRVAAAGEGEIDIRFTTMARMADNLMIYRYVVQNVVRRRGLTAHCAAKPPLGNNGSGMRVYQSIWHRKRPLFAGDGYAGSSALMRHYIAGLLEHAPALLAICAPRVRPDRRPGPVGAAPVGLGHAQRHRATVHRLSAYSSDPKAKRVEFRCPDPSCNPYLAFAAMLMAGIDGFHDRLYDRDPGAPIDQYIDDLSSRRPARLASVPAGARDALAADHAFLLKGDVFTPDVIEAHLGCVPA
jgi:glutamine synthetase